MFVVNGTFICKLTSMSHYYSHLTEIGITFTLFNNVGNIIVVWHSQTVFILNLSLSM